MPGAGRHHKKSAPPNPTKKLIAYGFERDFLKYLRLEGLRCVRRIFPNLTLRKFREALQAISKLRRKLTEIEMPFTAPALRELAQAENLLKAKNHPLRDFRGLYPKGGAPVDRGELYYAVYAMVCYFRFRNPGRRVPWELMRRWIEEKLDVRCGSLYHWWRDSIGSITEMRFRNLPTSIQSYVLLGITAWIAWKGIRPNAYRHLFHRKDPLDRIILRPLALRVVLDAYKINKDDPKLDLEQKSYLMAAVKAMPPFIGNDIRAMTHEFSKRPSLEDFHAVGMAC